MLSFRQHLVYESGIIPNVMKNDIQECFGILSKYPPQAPHSPLWLVVSLLYVQIQPIVVYYSVRLAITVRNGVFTPEQDNDKPTTRQMLNLCMPMPFTPDMSDLVWKAS